MAAGIVDQKELELDRNHGAQSFFGISLLDRRKCVAGIACEGATVLVIHPDWH